MHLIVQLASMAIILPNPNQLYALYVVSRYCIALLAFRILIRRRINILLFVEVASANIISMELNALHVFSQYRFVKLATIIFNVAIANKDTS